MMQVRNICIGATYAVIRDGVLMPFRATAVVTRKNDAAAARKSGVYTVRKVKGLWPDQTEEVLSPDELVCRYDLYLNFLNPER